MKQAFNRTRTFRGDSGGMYEGSDVGDLDQPLLAEIGSQCCIESTIDLVEHVTSIARVVSAARARHSVNDRGRRRTLGQVHAPAASEGDRL